jgi:hypothetical protein
LWSIIVRVFTAVLEAAGLGLGEEVAGGLLELQPENRLAINVKTMKTEVILIDRNLIFVSFVTFDMST